MHALATVAGAIWVATDWEIEALQTILMSDGLSRRYIVRHYS